MSKLGIERRQATRIQVPPRGFEIYPTFSVKNQKLDVFDLSSGGCCLLDPNQVLGPEIGREFPLTLGWLEGNETVNSRIVARVDHRRHIQFLNLKVNRVEQIRRWSAPASRAHSLRVLVAEEGRAPSIQAREIWNSLHGDHVILVEHLQRLAQIGLFGVPYTFFRNAWPVRDGSIPLTREEVTALTFFLFNIPKPSPALKELLSCLEQLSLEGAA